MQSILVRLQATVSKTQVHTVKVSKVPQISLLSMHLRILEYLTRWVLKAFGPNQISNIALAKLTKSNNEYYLFCETHLNNIWIVKDIQIFEYFQIICDKKMKDLLKYQKKVVFCVNAQCFKYNQTKIKLL